MVQMQVSLRAAPKDKKSLSMLAVKTVWIWKALLTFKSGENLEITIRE
jgi:hypothetical protein